MFSPKEHRMQICIRQSNLDEIGHKLSSQVSTLFILEAENEEQYHETSNALSEVNAITAEVEKLKDLDVKLFAKRMEVKRKCDEVAKYLEQAMEKRYNSQELLKQVENDIDTLRLQYEDSLSKIVELLKTSQVYYQKSEMQAKIEEVEILNNNLEEEIKDRESRLGKLREDYENMIAEIPEDILDILGKKSLEEKLQQNIREYEELKNKSM